MECTILSETSRVRVVVVVVVPGMGLPLKVEGSLEVKVQLESTLECLVVVVVVVVVVVGIPGVKAVPCTTDEMTTSVQLEGRGFMGTPSIPVTLLLPTTRGASILTTSTTPTPHRAGSLHGMVPRRVRIQCLGKTPPPLAPHPRSSK